MVHPVYAASLPDRTAERVVGGGSEDAFVLDESDRILLTFEEQWAIHSGRKRDAIRETLSLGTITYYQRLNRIIDSPEAAREFPMLVKRLQRIREERVSRRESRAFG